MKVFSMFGGSIAAAAAFLAGATSAGAAQQVACSVLPLADVRVIVGSPVDVYAPSSFKPTKRGDTTVSNCTYVVMGGNGKAARLTLMWAPAAKLSQTYQYYQKRNKELSRIKGDVLLMASVTIATEGEMKYDQPASQKLLDAALKKL